MAGRDVSGRAEVAFDRDVVVSGGGPAGRSVEVSLALQGLGTAVDGTALPESVDGGTVGTCVDAERRSRGVDG